MHPRTVSTSAKGASENKVVDMEGGGLYGCLSSKIFTVFSLQGATPDDPNTFTAA
ncbi:hypothetical protein A2U01_0117571, partial [Trifolium medium]|nr:hypothetical protein [Trifolium medium]